MDLNSKWAIFQLLSVQFPEGIFAFPPPSLCSCSAGCHAIAEQMRSWQWNPRIFGVFESSQSRSISINVGICMYHTCSTNSDFPTGPQKRIRRYLQDFSCLRVSIIYTDTMYTYIYTCVYIYIYTYTYLYLYIYVNISTFVHRNEYIIKSINKEINE